MLGPNIIGKFVAIIGTLGTEIDNNHTQWLSQAFKDSYPISSVSSPYVGYGSAYQPTYYDFNAHNSNAVYSDNGLILPKSISKQSYIIYK